jgi:hypothetical protein
MNERTTDGDALLHPAGELSRIGILETSEANEFEQLGSVFPMVWPHLPLENFNGEKDILKDCSPLKKDRRLERDPDVPDGFCDWFSMQQNLSGRRP